MTDGRRYQSSTAGMAHVYEGALEAPYTSNNAVVFDNAGRAIASCVDDRNAHNIAATLNAVAAALTKRKT